MGRMKDLWMQMLEDEDEDEWAEWEFCWWMEEQLSIHKDQAVISQKVKVAP